MQRHGFLTPFSSKSDQHQFSLNSTSILKCVEIVQQSFLCVLTFYQYHSVVSAWAIQCISGMDVLDLLLFSSSLL